MAAFEECKRLTHLLCSPTAEPIQFYRGVVSLRGIRGAGRGAPVLSSPSVCCQFAGVESDSGPLFTLTIRRTVLRPAGKKLDALCNEACPPPARSCSPPCNSLLRPSTASYYCAPPPSPIPPPSTCDPGVLLRIHRPPQPREVGN